MVAVVAAVEERALGVHQMMVEMVLLLGEEQHLKMQEARLQVAFMLQIITVMLPYQIQLMMKKLE